MKLFGFRGVMVLAIFAMLTGCAGQQSQTTPGQAVEASDENPFANEKKLAKSYANLVVTEFTATDEILRDYPAELAASRDAAVAALIQGGKYQAVLTDVSTAADGPTLLVKTHIPQMRIVGFNARFWAGAFAGSTDMVLEITCIDQQTGLEMVSKTLASNVNVMGATWSFGATDRSMPTDMGIIMAEYIQTVVPGITP